jgi:putative transposase
VSHPPRRRTFSHTPPPFVADGAWFFLTFCSEPRGINQLCQPAIGANLLADATLYHRQNSWVIHLFLLMPDHVHAILAIPAGSGLSETVRNWKRLTARCHGVRWQRNFFDHRLRPDEGLELKAAYIRHNPVRAGLVAQAESWPYFLDFRSLAGR